MDIQKILNSISSLNQIFFLKMIWLFLYIDIDHLRSQDKFTFRFNKFKVIGWFPPTIVICPIYPMNHCTKLTFINIF